MEFHVDIYNSVAACAWAFATVFVFAMTLGRKK